ncbi:MAG: TatD family hydrolase [Chloroflexi bacterium]|jgi:TatD DNase family protein|nr:TatD family hydrolase [Chloroflexota bacterium]
MRLVDSHAHVQLGPFRDDIEAVLGAARAAGVERILVPGVDVLSSEEAIALVGRFQWLDAAVGTHPHVAAEVDVAARRRIAELARAPEAVAIGETGLDFDRLWSPIADQLANLRWNLALALELGKPAILHCRSKPGQRDAQDALLEELAMAGFGDEPARRAFGDRPSAVLHSVSGPPDYVAAAVALGCAVSVSGLAFRRGEEATAESVRLVLADRLLVETDAPYLAPPGAPRRRNAPEWVAVTAAWVAEARGDDVAAAGDALVAAYDQLYRAHSPGEVRSR